MSTSYRLVEPAPRSALLACAGAHARVRLALYAQGRSFPTIAIYHDNTVLAVVSFQVHSCKRLQFALSLGPHAKAHLKGLIRLAHSTLAKMAESHCIFASVHPANKAGRHMAWLTGFRPSRAGPQFWIYGRPDE
ncbi:MAG: hypothetical protein ACRCU5_13895 [Rhizobiaceae bacterium]